MQAGGSSGGTGRRRARGNLAAELMHTASRTQASPAHSCLTHHNNNSGQSYGANHNARNRPSAESHVSAWPLAESVGTAKTRNRAATWVCAGATKGVRADCATWRRRQCPCRLRTHCGGLLLEARVWVGCRHLAAHTAPCSLALLRPLCYGCFCGCRRHCCFHGSCKGILLQLGLDIMAHMGWPATGAVMR